MSFRDCLTRAKGPFLQNLSYAQLGERVGQAAAYLQSLGLGPGKRLLLSCESETHLSALSLAALCLGTAVVLVDTSVKAGRIAGIVASSRPDWAIVDQRLADSWALGERCTPVSPTAPAGGLLRRLLGKKSPTGPATAYPAVAESLTPPASWPSVEPETPALILFTSGTTSDTKAVVLTHRNLLAHLRTLASVYHLGPPSRLLNVLNLYHVDGFVQGPLLALWSGVPLFRPCRFDVTDLQAYCASVYRERITHAWMTPAMLAILDRYGEGLEETFRTPDFQMIISCTAHLEAPLWERAGARFGTPIVNVYGLTETVAGSCFCGPDAERFRLGTIGKPVDCEARIVEGELLLRGEHVMPGYLDNPEANAAVFADGWLRTGDLAEQDADGFLRIVGRKKNLVISGGFNVHPEEVNEVLSRHPGVAESVCFGVEDAILGERLVAVVAPADLQSADLVEFCRGELEPEKVPQEILAVAALPRGRSDKVQLPEARALYAAHKLEARASGANRLATVLALAAETFRVAPSSLDEASKATTVPGWDSLSHFRLLMALEERFGLLFTPREMVTMDSIASIDKILAARVG